ncbi:MAG TPA: helix-turn-helix domain-containing protein [Tepidisphaeraceae bacterium]|jgi:hypothetical protein|nr:helix-turn-helix domain-containing protein [Tepidisphaeraceae bacterium]
MAKMFYTLDEAKSALGKSEDEIKAYAREGRLREFRDGPRLMFKADQVEQLKSELTGGDNVDLGVSDSGGLIGLVDTTGASGTSITLSDDVGQSSGGMRTKEDTALAADLGLSGTMGAVPSPTVRSMREGPLSGTGLSGTASGSRAGINVFGDTEEHVDPSAQTAITGGIREQINLEGVGSGSGLLDLTRESDDTSLGAVLDGIGPAIGGRGQVGTMDTSELMDDDDEPVVTRTVAAPVYVTKADPLAPAFGGAALGAAAVLMFGLYVLFASMAGTWPDATKYFNKEQWFILPAGGAGLVVVLFIIGLVIGKVTSSSSRS